jgi:hypothetical protein
METMATLNPHRTGVVARTKSVAAYAAAAIGLGAGAVFGEPFLDLVVRIWTGFLLPAYVEIQQSGLPFCG